MKPVLRLLTILFPAFAAISAATAAGIDYGTLSSAVAQVLEQGHYSRRPLNADVSKKFLNDYLENLDPDHLYFTHKDVETIAAAHALNLGSDVLLGRLAPAFEIFNLYKKRVNARAEKINTLLKEGTFDFASNRTVEISREHSTWPADQAEADQLWSDRIEGELLDEKLNGSPMAECLQTVRNRYAQVRSEIMQESHRDTMAIVLNALACAYDPHSEYLRKEDLEDLDSDMRLSMVGIGVVIEGDGRYAKIVGLLPGSPAAADGRLKVNDRIVAIAKGDGGFVDTAGMSIDRVLALIRGKKGTRVRLKVTSPGAAEAIRQKEIALVSRNIELVDEEAKAEIVERPDGNGGKERLGWISLPSFYGDPEHPNGRSVTRDVRSLVTQLKQANVDGMVIDLRNNPGGELEEAVGVGGLFLGQMPIVQEKDRSGKIYVSRAESRELYDGPLVVLTDHMTASAAELLAGALQDYGRAVVVGGHYATYGKGSVQTVVEMGDVIEGARQGDTEQLGALQITIAKFYRINGQSTQLRGLTADIQLPSPEDLPQDGESAMRNPLEYDETKPVRLAMAAFNHSLPVTQLRERSFGRVAADTEFRYLVEDLDRACKKDGANRLSLNETTRRAEMDEEKARNKQRELDRKQKPAPEETVVRITPGALRIKKTETSRASAKKFVSAAEPDAGAAKQPDPIRTESLNILCDLVRLSSVRTDAAASLVDTSTAKADSKTKAR
jgi:carboxyl-terminal processing protease